MDEIESLASIEKSGRGFQYPLSTDLGDGSHVMESCVAAWRTSFVAVVWFGCGSVVLWGVRDIAWSLWSLWS